MRMHSPLVAVAVLAALASCTAPDSSPTALHPSAPALAAAKVSNPTATFVISNDGANLLRGDGLSPDGAGDSRYLNGDCAVSTVIYAQSGGSGDATLTMGRGKCTRNVRITYASINADGNTTSEGSLTTSSFLNLRKLEVAASHLRFRRRWREMWHRRYRGDRLRSAHQRWDGDERRPGPSAPRRSRQLDGDDAARRARPRRTHHPSRQGLLPRQRQAVPHAAALHHHELRSTLALSLPLSLPIEPRSCDRGFVVSYDKRHPRIAIVVGLTTRDATAS